MNAEVRPTKPAKMRSTDEARDRVFNRPIVPTMLRLGTPTIFALMVQTLVGVAQIYFISFLGSQAVASATLVFPLLMLMAAVAGTAIGGGVASAVGRACGAGRKDEADALLVNALLVAVVFGLLCTAADVLGARSLYAILGGKAEVLDDAVTYSHALFAGSALAWVLSLLSAALRGAGNVRVPALVSFASTITIPITPILIFGWGPLPAFGIAGAGIAWNIFNAVGCLMLLGYLRRSNGPLRLSYAPGVVRLALLQKILSVGLLSTVSAIQSNLTVVIVTGTVGILGGDAIAGFGLASRIDYIFHTLMFGLGTAIVTMVSMSFGAGQIAQARRIAATGACLSFAVAGTLGVLSAVFAETWLGAFSKEASVIETGRLYLQYVAPAYSMYGFGLAWYFACQGAGQLIWAVLAGTVRFAIAAFVGLAVVRTGGDKGDLFITICISLVVYGLLSAGSFYISVRSIGSAFLKKQS